MKYSFSLVAKFSSTREACKTNPNREMKVKVFEKLLKTTHIVVLFVLEVFDPSDELVAVQAVGDVTASQELVLQQEAQLPFVHHVFDHKLDEFLNKTNT